MKFLNFILACDNTRDKNDSTASKWSSEGTGKITGTVITENEYMDLVQCEKKTFKCEVIMAGYWGKFNF